MNNSPALQAVLFDLDGTILDTAPDLAFALNTLLKMHGRGTLPFETLRPLASLGAMGLVTHGFQINTHDNSYEPLRKQFLELYEQHLTQNTTLFPGIAEVLHHLESHHLPWGIVTNKYTYLTLPLLDYFGLRSRAACIVSGDTTPHPKPHPAPLHFACEEIKCVSSHCIYVGDSQNDIEAGRSAGMQTVLATYGYVTPSENFSAWCANGQIAHPMELLSYIRNRTIG